MEVNQIYKLKYTFTFIFAVLSLTLVLIIGAFANIFIKNNFDRYVKNNLEYSKKNILENINNAFLNNRTKDLHLMENIGMNALESGLIINITDKEGNEIWNARTHNEGMCEAILKKMSSNMNKLYSGFKGNYTEEKYDLIINNEKQGELVISYYGPYFYSDSEIIFFKTLNKILVLTGFVYMIFSVLAGFIISSLISRPLLRVINSAEQISKGNYKHRIEQKSQINEINQLIVSVNKLSEDLGNQEKIRKVMTKDISHELRTPLAVAQGQLEALIDGVWEVSPERLNSLYEEIQRLTRLIDSMGNLSKYESESIILYKKPLDIKVFIEKLVFLFEKEFYNKNITCDLDLTGGEAQIDRDKMSQALINIISNSVKYTPNGGEILIKSFREKGHMHIIIRDNGKGIENEHLPYVFERFYRGDESRSRLTGGSGIGLTISKAIIEAHGGEIIIKSTIGKGTEIRIIL